MHTPRKIAWLVAGVAIIAFGAACGGGGSDPGSGAPADPLASSAALNQAGAAFNTPVLQSLNALSSSFDLTTLSSPIPVQTRALLQVIRPRRDLAGQPTSINFARARQLRSLVPMLSSPTPRTPIAGLVTRTPIPGIQAHLGVTFEWTLANGYGPTATAGAPGNGIRIILYETDPSTGAIVTVGGQPTPIGYADLTDEGSGGTYAIGVKLVDTSGSPVTLADYGITVTPGSNSFTAGTRTTGPNYITDGVTRIDFTTAISANGTTDQVSIDGSLTLNNPAVTATASVTVDFTNPNAVTLAATFSFTYAGETASLALTGTIDANGDATQASATFRINGRFFASVTVVAGQPGVVHGPGGRQLTGEEQTYIQDVLNAPVGIFDAIGGLAEPGLEVTGQDTSGLHL